MTSRWTGAAGLLGSMAVHAAAFVVLGTFGGAEDLLRQDPVEVAIIEVPPEQEPTPEAPPEPAAPEPPAPEPEPVKPAPRAPREPVQPLKAPEEPPPPAAAEQPPAPADETIADFSGTTLVGEGAGGWVSAVGSGAAMNGPIGRAGAAVTGRDRQGVAGGVPDGTGLRVVPLANLSRRPAPPSEDVRNEALQRNYPKGAQQQGIEGVAHIKIRVLPSGKIQPLATISETYPGFGDACRASVRDLAFDPGLDSAGQPVATDTKYECTFSVE